MLGFQKQIVKAELLIQEDFWQDIFAFLEHRLKLRKKSVSKW